MGTSIADVFNDDGPSLGQIVERAFGYLDYLDAPPAAPPAEGDSPFGRTGSSRTLNGGTQWLFEFPNGFGASVVRHSISYGHESGLWELGVLDSTGNLTYETPITKDVIGHLDEADVTSLLARIEAL